MFMRIFVARGILCLCKYSLRKLLVHLFQKFHCTCDFLKCRAEFLRFVGRREHCLNQEFQRVLFKVKKLSEQEEAVRTITSNKFLVGLRVYPAVFSLAF